MALSTERERVNDLCEGRTQEYSGRRPEGGTNGDDLGRIFMCIYALANMGMGDSYANTLGNNLGVSDPWCIQDNDLTS